MGEGGNFDCRGLRHGDSGENENENEKHNQNAHVVDWDAFRSLFTPTSDEHALYMGTNIALFLAKFH